MGNTGNVNPENSGSPQLPTPPVTPPSGDGTDQGKSQEKPQKPMKATERFTEILAIYKQLMEELKADDMSEANPEVKQDAKVPSCKCAAYNVLELHALAALVMILLFLLLGNNSNACIVLIICMSVLWVISLFVSLCVVKNIYEAKMALYRSAEERRSKEEDAHKSRLFKYLDEALAACWEETAPKKEEQNPTPPAKPE